MTPTAKIKSPEDFPCPHCGDQQQDEHPCGVGHVDCTHCGKPFGIDWTETGAITRGDLTAADYEYLRTRTPNTRAEQEARDRDVWGPDE